METGIEELQEQLHDKEQLVAALTARLEQTAEQLDRARRSGTGGGSRVLGGLPPKLVEEQQSLTENLQRVLQQWEDLQAAATLGRLELQVSELRDFLADRLDHTTAESPVGPGQDSANGRSPARNAVEDTDQPQEGAPASKWEAVKASILNADKTAAEEHVEPSTSAKQVSEPTRQDAEATEPDVDEIGSLELPEAIDIATADAEQMQQAIESRDAHIAQLMRLLKSARAKADALPDWNSLNNAPEELRERLELLEGRWKEKQRFAEVDISLERARLARVENRLEQKEEYIRKAMKRAGLSDDDLDGEDPGTPSHDPQEKENRWMRFLNRN